MTPLPTLPFHLSLSLSALTSSSIASACLNHVLPNVAPESLPQAVSEVAQERLRQLLNGVSRYIHSDDAPEIPTLPTVWRQGSVRLLSCLSPVTGHSSPTLLLVPSLINRHYILDLTRTQSMVRFLAKQGINCLVVDWGMPGEVEKSFNVADYVEKPLAAAFEFARQTSGAPVHVLGYCMGGVLALALAQQFKKDVASLSLLASPWDFHAGNPQLKVIAAPMRQQLEEWVASHETFPSAWLQLLFYWNVPWLFEQKFRRFADLKEGSPAYLEFLALERWVNDGVPLTRGVAKDCLIEWPLSNALARGAWKVFGEALNPAKLSQRTLMAVPKHDQIVPPLSALALKKLMKKAKLLEPDAGHVGMIVGQRNSRELWERVAAFILNNK